MAFFGDLANGLGGLWHNLSGSAAQNEFERNMSNTAYQRQVLDMQNAGLNPAMMYSSGSDGASTPNSAHSNSSILPSLSGIASVLSSAASLTNNKNIDKETTKQIYNSAGKLMKTVETSSRKS